MAIFRGTTNQCLAHLFSKDFDKDVRASLADFAGVSLATARRWKTSRSVPQGETLLKSRFFLELLGYEVTELEDLDPIVRKLGRIFSYGLVTPRDLAQMLGYTVRPRSTMEVLVGRHGLPRERHEKAKSYVAAFDEQLNAARRVLLQNLSTLRENKKRVGPGAEAPVPVVAINGHDAQSVVLDEATHHVKRLASIADYLLSDNCSEEDRKKLHELAGADGVLKLIIRLKRLCSETARRQLKDI